MSVQEQSKMYFFNREDKRKEAFFHLGANAALILSMGVLFLTALVWIIDPPEMILFTCLNLSLISFIIIQLCRVASEKKSWLFFINPAVLTSTVTFLLLYGLSNIYYYLPLEVGRRVGFDATMDHSVNKEMLLCIIAVVGLWVGYRSGIARNLGRRIISLAMDSSIIRKFTRINWFIFFIFLTACFAARLLGIRFGLYGYASDASVVIVHAGILEYINIGNSLGRLLLAVICFSLFSGKRSWGVTIMFWVILTSEIFFGFVSGSKGNVVIPLLIVAFCYYCCRGKLPKWIVPASIAAFIFAYSIIEPFRIFRHAGGGMEMRSLAAITEVLSVAYEESDISYDFMDNVGMRILARLNLTAIGAQGIAYVDDGGGELLPPFLSNIVLAPAYALIPRLVWPSKPKANFGGWYAVTIMGRNAQTNRNSIGMGPVTYLYFAGGWLAVFLVFIVVGVIQRAVFDGFVFAGIGGLIIYLGILNSLAIMSSDMSAYFVVFIRYGFLMILAQFFLFKNITEETDLTKNKTLEV